MAGTWYPNAIGPLVSWQATFNTECHNYATPLASVLTAGVLTQTAANAAMTLACANYLTQAKNFRAGVVRYVRSMLSGKRGTALSTPPVPPAAMVVPVGAMAAIEDFTSVLVGQIKAHPNYNVAMGRAMGIEPGEHSTGTPKVILAALGGGHVRVTVMKARYAVVALDRRINGGEWVQIAIVTVSPYMDMDPPLVAGVAEAREYRAQGFVRNERTGPVSPSVSIGTTP